MRSYTHALLISFFFLSCAQGHRAQESSDRVITFEALRSSGLISSFAEAETEPALFLASFSTQREALPSPLLEDRPEVQSQILYLTKRDRRIISDAIDRGQPFYGIFSKIFRDEGIPQELINVAIIESGFRQTARSSAGAVGFWQFMSGTGKVYGLKITESEDQREDPILSTIAAARHLKDLYRAYKDWKLVLAAYNAGSAAVDRAINRGQTSDFWTLSRQGYFSRETRAYVPRFLAITTIMANLDAYGFQETKQKLLLALGKGPKISPS